MSAAVSAIGNSRASHRLPALLATPLLALILLLPAGRAAAQELVADLSSHLVAITAGFFVLFRFTTVGKSMEIAGKYPEGAAAIGLPVERLYRFVWLIGSAMALLAGAFLVTGTPVTPFQSLEYLVIAVIVGIAARLSFAGAAAAAVLFGLGNPLLVALTNRPQLSSAAIYGFFLVVIAVTPLISDYRPLSRLFAGRASGRSS